MRLQGTILYCGRGCIELDIRYSVDMVKLKTRLKVDYVEKIISLFSSEPNCLYWEKRGIGDYRHNFKFDEGSNQNWYLAVQHNSALRSAKVDVVLKYNPNKCKCAPLLDYVLANFYRNSPNVEVLSMDIACDIPCNILDLSFRKGKRDMITYDKGSDNKTFYIGARGSNGYSKIYNKKRESSLDYELTRYEITILPKMLISSMINGCYQFDDDLLLPISYVGGFQFRLGDELSGQDKLNVLACMDNPNLLGLLDKRKAKKIREILSLINPLPFDTANINLVISDFLKTIYTY